MKSRRAIASEIAPYVDAARSFSGWPPPHAPQPVEDATLPWNYAQLARDAIANDRAVLDLGTGGGDVFRSLLADGLHFAVAVEEWPVNVHEAQATLAGAAHVVHASAEALPFADASFDVVLSRHTAVTPLDVVRVLKGGGTFVTQQVVHDYGFELAEFFPAYHRFEDHYGLYCEALQAAGMQIEQHAVRRWRCAYRSVGEVASHLLTAPWIVPGFDPVREIEALARLDAVLDDFTVTAGNYLIVARR